MELTLRQFEVICAVKRCGVISTGFDGSVLKALESKGLVIRHFTSFPGGVSYTWTLSKAGKEVERVRISA